MRWMWIMMSLQQLTRLLLLRLVDVTASNSQVRFHSSRHSCRNCRYFVFVYSGFGISASSASAAYSASSKRSSPQPLWPLVNGGWEG